MVAIAGLVVAGGLAGCLGEDGPSPGTEEDRAGATSEPGPSFETPTTVSKEWPGAEPVVDVAPDGTVYLQGFGATGQGAGAHLTNSVWRSTDGGATWTDVTPPLTGRQESFDGFVAVDGDGTVYVANAAGTQLDLWRSDDRGESWLPSPEVPYPSPMHRMWMVAEDEATVHLTVDKFTLSPPFETWYMRTVDDGRTWTPPTLVTREASAFGGLGSNLAMDPGDGTLYQARLSTPDAATGNSTEVSDGTWVLLTSTDDGVTWTEREMFDLDATLASAWQSLSVDADGTLYLVWSQEVPGTGAAKVHVAHSGDGGQTWSSPRAIAPSNGTAAMPWASARAPGELGIVWYAADTPTLPGDANATWHVDYALVEDADTGDPTVHRTRVSEGPVHEGSVCTVGPLCGQDDDWRLRDYPWVTFGPDGRAHLAFASTMWDRPDAFPLYAAETTPFDTDGNDGTPDGSGMARTSPNPPSTLAGQG